MFEHTKLLFLYAVTPVHMGAGQAIGVIDNPIQRERHTNHPSMAGSGLKGAVRHQAATMDKWDKSLVDRLFGPDSQNGELHAGAVSFGDAQLAAFPVRSLKQAFVYAVSPTTLARLHRLATLEGSGAPWVVPQVQPNQALVCDDRVLNQDKLVLEAFEFAASGSDDLRSIAQWIAHNALPQEEEHKFFREKISNDLVLLPDDAFSYFVENATVVEPHVRISDETGTAAKGGLFYTENLPPESLMVAPVFASVERSKHAQKMRSSDVMNLLASGLGKRLLQVGGDATTGRGQVLMHFMGNGGVV